ncbi:hypothetical protein [Streptomyces sp. NPDC046371]|uniref:hypothetical protein n=1 Tax=Streptomyces sp. NPDC046371 TaxID=3154916 RepID=UPI0034073E6C
MTVSTPDPNEFDRIVSGLNPHQAAPQYAEFYDPHPYGPPAPAAAPMYPQAKPGLTTRGKVGIGVVTAVLAGGALLGYQSHTASVAASQAQAKEMDLRAQLLRIEELKEMNRANETSRKSESAEEKTRQVSVDSCINKDKGMVGKGFGSPSYREVIDNCLTQYGTSKDTKFETAGSASQVTAQAGGGEINSGWLVAGGAFVLFVVWAAKRGTRPNNA